MLISGGMILIGIINVVLGLLFWPDPPPPVTPAEHALPAAGEAPALPPAPALDPAP